MSSSVSCLKETTEPLDLCVLIPCYNNIAGLITSLRSIKYHPGKLLVLVVDDGSAERITADVLTPHLEEHLALEVLNLPVNSGITSALNAGLQWITKHLSVKYIARLDCADLCHEERFLEQVKYLDSHADVGLLGTWCTFKNNPSGFSYTYKTPTEHAAILKELHYRNVFIHPTTMFRATLLQKLGLYPEDFPHVEDYALFWKMASITLTAVIPKSLVTCEINEKGISQKNREEQLKGRYKVVKKFATCQPDKILGLLKLELLMLIPYKFILKIKGLRETKTAS